MAKTKTTQPAKLGDTVEMLKPYLERAMHDEEFRKDLKDAMVAARELYGPLSKRGGGVKGSAKVIATDRKTQEQLLRAMEDIAGAAVTLKAVDKPKKKGKKGRKALLLAGVIAGALYNPWTGPQTREKLLDLIAGDDDLQPLEGFDVPAAEDAASNAAEAVEDVAADAAAAAEDAADAATDAEA
jgi:hypothetical protein